MKNCQAINCIMPIFSHGYCRNHQYLRKDEKYDRRTPIQKHFDKQKKLLPKNNMINKATFDEDVSEWFRFHMEHSVKRCENCGADLSNYKEKDWRGSQHHIIEKSEINGCPSVAAEILNHGVLGKWCCHSQWHTSWDNAQKMPFFSIAKDRFETFKHLIHKSEQRKIPNCFL